MKNINRIATILAATAAITVGIVSPASAQSSIPNLHSSLPSFSVPSIHDFVPASSGMGSSSPVQNAPVMNTITGANSTGQEAQFEAETIRLVNQHRISRGLSPVVYDPALSAQAKSWAGQMAVTGNWNDSPQHNGYEAVAVTSHGNPDSMFNQWKDTNAVNKQGLSRVGVGIVINNGSTYGNIQFL